MSPLPKIAISLGDPAGIGPEVTLKAILEGPAFEARLFGSKSIAKDPLIQDLLEQCKQAQKKIDWVDTGSCKIQIGVDHPDHAQSSFKSLQWAMDASQTDAEALVTAPISKRAWQLAKIPFKGHTDYFQSLSKTPVSMAFHSPNFNIILHSIHIPLSEVPQTIREDLLEKTFQNTLKFAKVLGIKSPKIAIAGLNPHAGENGLLGKEETAVIQPFVASHQGPGYSFLGPYPPDTLFHFAKAEKIDIIIALYHDQGLIPLKLLDFDSAVNISLGLPFFRASPDHGTAYDIAYQNRANPQSMRSAILSAIQSTQAS